MSIRTRRSPSSMDNNRPRSMDPSTLEALASSLRDLNEDYTMSSYRPRTDRGRSLARSDAVAANTSSATGASQTSSFTASADSSSGTASPLPSRATGALAGVASYTGPSSNTAAQYVASGSGSYSNPSGTAGPYVGPSSAGYAGSNAPYVGSAGVGAYEPRGRAASPYTTNPASATTFTVKPALEKKPSRDGGNPTKNLSRQSSLGSFPDKYTFTDDKQGNSLVFGLKELYKHRQLVDVVLCVDDEEFSCHRVVLASSSPYFHAMFTADLAESRQDKIRIGVVDASSMRLVLDYIYTATIEITEGNVQGLMLAVNMFQMNNLRDACAHFLERHVTLSNCIGIYFFAVAHNCTKLEVLSIDMISENYGEVCKEEEFLQLSKDRLIDLLVRDDLNVDQEETVYESAISWVRDDLENRRADLHDVLSHVRFALISPYYIHDVVERDRLVVHNKSVQHIVDAALQYHVLRDRRQDLDLSKLNTNTRKGMPIKDMFVFLTHHTEAIPETWTSDLYRIKPLPDMIEYAECVVSGENNLFVAGRSPQEFTGSRRFAQRRGGLFQYDHFDKKWLPRGCMNIPRNYFSMAVLDGMIYVSGGTSGDVVQDSVECYNTNTNIWRQVAPMLQAAKSHCLATVGGRLYAVGGETNEAILDTVQCYNPRFDSWSHLTSMTLPRTSSGVAVLNREIYVLGGSVALGEKQPENMLKSVEIFHPDRNEWRFGPELPEGKINYCAATHNGKLYVFGGDTGEEASGIVQSKVYRLDADNFVWVEDKSGWPNLQPPFYCLMARLNKNA